MSDLHAYALQIVHSEAKRTLSKDHFELCMRIAKRAMEFGAYSPEAVNQEYKPEPVRAYPEELTPALRRVLGMMLWETTPIAHALRASGHAIARKCEDEQAVVLHWLTGIVLTHGDAWQQHAAIELRKLTDAMG